MKRSVLIPALCACLIALPACGLLPKEEEHHTAPVIQTTQQEEYEFAYVQRGDLEQTATVNCVYQPVQTEALSFPVGGVAYDQVYVSLGDKVKKGQLLAQLELSGADEALAAREQRLKELALEMDNLEENRGYALERTELQLQDGSWSKLQEALDNVNADYDLQKQALEDEQYITQLEKEEYEAALNARQIRANFDGTVTTLKKMPRTETSVAGSPVITVSDTDNAVFMGSTPLWDHFQQGQTVEIDVRGTVYTATVVTEEELGLPPVEKEPGKAAKLYFKPSQPVAAGGEAEAEGEGSEENESGEGESPEGESGTEGESTSPLTDNSMVNGTIKLLLDSRKDVLLLPRSALSTAGGETVVYYVDENGLRAYKTVEIGLESHEMVEVLSGVQEGEAVIVG